MFTADKIDINDYFAIRSLNMREGKVSRDQRKVYFGDVYIEVDWTAVAKDVPFDDGSQGKVIGDEERDLYFPPSKSVAAHVLTQAHEADIYWLLVLATDRPKSHRKGGVQFTAIISVGKI